MRFFCYVRVCVPFPSPFFFFIFLLFSFLFRFFYRFDFLPLKKRMSMCRISRPKERTGRHKRSGEVMRNDE